MWSSWLDYIDDAPCVGSVSFQPSRPEGGCEREDWRKGPDNQMSGDDTKRAAGTTTTSLKKQRSLLIFSQCPYRRLLNNILSKCTSEGLRVVDVSGRAHGWMLLALSWSTLLVKRKEEIEASYVSPEA